VAPGTGGGKKVERAEEMRHNNNGLQDVALSAIVGVRVGEGEHMVRKQVNRKSGGGKAGEPRGGAIENGGNGQKAPSLESRSLSYACTKLFSSPSSVLSFALLIVV